MRKVIVDCDPGIDDLLALWYLLDSKEVEIVAFTIVNGNVSEEIGSINTQKLLKLKNKQIPVYKGQSGRYSEAEFHGKDGIMDIIDDLSDIDISDSKIETESAEHAIIRIVNENPNEIEFLAIGPLTNFANALDIESTFTEKLKSVTIMGGNLYGIGNMTLTAEFNFWFDWDAAFKVVNGISKSCPSTMVTWECTKTAQFRLDEILPAAKTNSKINMHARLKKLIDPKNPNLANICDLVAAIVLVNPELILEEENCPVTVELAGNYTKGMMVLNRAHSNPYDHKVDNLADNVIFRLPTKIRTTKIDGLFIDTNLLDINK